jgi:hypothetical protein
MTDHARNARRRARRAARKAGIDSPQRERPARGVCGAVRKGKGLCRRPAGYGTDHPGVGRCKQHGGNSPAGIKAAAVIIGEGSILTGKTAVGIPIEMEPADALTRTIAITAGELAYCSAQIHQLGHADVFEQDYLGRRQLNLWIRERHKCIDRLARLAKMALDAGIAERQVALAEAEADRIVLVVSRLMDGLDLTDDQQQRLEQVLPTVLATLETRPAPAAPLG